MPDDDYKPPQRSASDDVHVIVRALLGMAPIAGAPAVELFNRLITPPLEKRRDVWREGIVAGLVALEERVSGLLGSLPNNPTFLDTLMQAALAAIRTSQQEKLEALRNAILNAALPEPPDASLQQMFLSYVDRFTVWHLRILSLFEGPDRFANLWDALPAPKLVLEGAWEIVEKGYHELKGRRTFSDQVLKDLEERGLLNLGGSTRAGEKHPDAVTVLGRKFLDFIREPDVLSRDETDVDDEGEGRET